MANKITRALTNLESVLCDADGYCTLKGSDADRVTVEAAIAELRYLAEGLPAQLRAIRAVTGNPLFDAGTHDACDKLEQFLGK